MFHVHSGQSGHYTISKTGLMNTSLMHHRWTAGHKSWIGSWLQNLDRQLVTNPGWAAGYKSWMGSWLQPPLGSWLQILDMQLVTDPG